MNIFLFDHLINNRFIFIIEMYRKCIEKEKRDSSVKEENGRHHLFNTANLKTEKFMVPAAAAAPRRVVTSTVLQYIPNTSVG